MRKLSPGSPYDLSAATFNSFVDAAQDFKNRQANTSTQIIRDRRSSGIVKVKNDTAGAVDHFNILGIDSPLILPSANEDEFLSQVALVGVTPATPTHDESFIVLLEPIPAGKIGSGMAIGICTAKINVSDADHTYAIVANGATVLASATGGPAQILWKEDGIGAKWAVVKVGGGGVNVGTHSNPLVLNSGTSETANTDIWNRYNQGAYDGVSIPISVRPVYNWEGDRILYKMVRILKFDNLGILYEVTAETRLEIDATETC